MSYAVKELFLTLQGEGVQAGRRAVFVRFTGCNLWSGLEKDRAEAICQFCDTDFIGMDGEGGGRFNSAEALVEAIADRWGSEKESRFVVLTGGEPMLQVDSHLIDALHAEGFFIAIESNGTLAVPRAIDWICISPKAQSETVQRTGDELKLVWPQDGSDWQGMESWGFPNLLLQPKDAIEDSGASKDHLEQAIAFVQAHPKWRLSLQNHKILGLA
ncbi:MAG: 7-carboxy-7-deazaguanine synthase [Sphingorhabdus sp.]